MTNRARPSWTDGTDSAKTQRPPQGGNGQAPSNPSVTPTSNGSSNGSTPQPTPPNGQQKAGELRPQPAPASQPVSKPQRPPQQPPVRPAAGQGSSGRSVSPASGSGTPSAAPPSPGTPGRPEQRFQSTSPSPAQPATAAYGQAGKSYGQVGKVASPANGKSTESFGDRVSAAKQAVLDKAAAVKEAATADKGRPPSSAAHAAHAAHAAGAPAASSVGASTARTTSRPRGQVRKARLRLSRVDPWSVMKTAFLLSIAFGIVLWVAVFIVWSAIGAAGVFDNINNTVSEVLGTSSAEPFRIENYINTGKVMGFTTLLACADVLIITALATLGSFLYNIAATLLGGLEVTLASED
jgi:Transmembrane domain of unknown function (DUF3566)